MNPLVVKVGGSLYDWPEFAPTLTRWLRDNARDETLIVPGGGPFAHAVRRLAEVQKLDEETAHWLAVRSMTIAASFLNAFLKDLPGRIVDVWDFSQSDEALPHSWSASSDSIAARLAEKQNAQLTLLKSRDPPPGDYADWAAAGYVDSNFPRIAARGKLTSRCAIRSSTPTASSRTS